MKGWWFLKGIKILFFVLLLIAAMTFVVMSLWNWLMPAVFNTGMITFWQALGVLVLAKILFGFGRGGWGHHHGRHWKYRSMYWDRQMQDKLKNMTPEEREKFREEWRQRCGWRYQQHFSGEQKDEPNANTN